MIIVVGSLELLICKHQAAIEGNSRCVIVMGDTIEKVSNSSIPTKVSILSILAKSIGNSIPLEPAMFLVSIPDQWLILHEGNRLNAPEGKKC